MAFSADKDREIIRALAPAGYYMGIRIRQSKADLVFNTYPPEWQERYAAMSYRLRDPTIAWGFANNGAARWSALAHLDTAGIFADAAAHGLKHGLVIGTGEIKARTLAGFARPDRPFARDEIEWLQDAVQRLHTRNLPQSITFRELQALRLVAAGKPYAIAAHMLGISTGALRARLTSVRSRLGAPTIPEAIQVARRRTIV